MAAAISIPWMLIPKPCVLISRMQSKPEIPPQSELDNMIEMKIKHGDGEEKKALLGDVQDVSSPGVTGN